MEVRGISITVSNTDTISISISTNTTITELDMVTIKALGFLGLCLSLRARHVEFRARLLHFNGDA